MTKDGALSFAEFCTAMHLVVLRVRNFDLPNELPAKLQPYAPLIDFNSETALNINANEAKNNNIDKADDSSVVIFFLISSISYFNSHDKYTKTNLKSKSISTKSIEYFH